MGGKKDGDADTSGSKKAVVERVMKEASAAALIFPLLTRTNYNEWQLLMQINLEAMGLWDAIETGDVDRREDRLAMAALVRGVPAELYSTVGTKKTAKEAWEAVKTMRMGDARVQEANAQKLLKQFEMITFKDGENVDDFAVRITDLAANLRALGETIEEACVVKKFLRVVPKRYSQIAVSIEMFLDINKLTMEELVGRLRAVEDRFDDSMEQVTDKAG